MARQLEVKGAQVKLFRAAMTFKLIASLSRISALLLSLLPFTASAHVGSPNVFFEGKAGPYPVHVIIKPAEVIPGLAEISVRIDGSGIDRVTALPIKWNAGRKGAPPPDVAKPVRGETNLFNTQLWFMEGGSQSVELEITGANGVGRVTIPVDAVARRVLTMPKGLGALLAILGIMVAMLLVSIIGAAVRESIVEPGLGLTRRRRIQGVIAMGLTALIIVSLLVGGKRWWNSEAADYQNNRLYRPVDASADIRIENGQRILRIGIADYRFDRSAPFVPDHGKLMHLFLMREPGLDVFAHLHPTKLNRTTFETPLPAMPAGTYQFYADVTYETGFSDTLTNRVEIPAPLSSASDSRNIDPDDSWTSSQPIGNGSSSTESALNDRYKMIWDRPASFVPNQPLDLRFRVTDRENRVVALQPYLGMKGHLALRRVDGAVFTHLHPGGSASMAAMQLSVLRAEGKLPLRAAFGESDPICEIPGTNELGQSWVAGLETGAGVSFPYAFPRPGAYRIWVQVKVDGQILTGTFDATASEPGSVAIAR